jgi:hypothetical protein
MKVNARVELSEWGRAMCNDAAAPGVVLESTIVGEVTWLKVQWADGECGMYSSRQLRVRDAS